MNVDIMTAVMTVIVSRHYALMSAEMLSGKFHAERLRFFRRPTALCISRIERENEVVAFDVTGFSILFVVLVGDLAVDVVRPRCGVDCVDEYIFSQDHFVLFIVDGAGVTVVLEQDVGDEVVIVAVVDVDVFENCQVYLLYVS